MQTTPARMISSAHTLAKMGRLIKKLTNLVSIFSPPFVAAVCAGARQLSADRLHRRSVDKKLDSGDDDPFPLFQSTLHRIVIPDGVAESH